MSGIIAQGANELSSSLRLRKAKEIVPDGEHLCIEQDGNTMTLTVNNVTLKDAGLYVCVLTNSAGSCKCSGELLVEGEGRIMFIVQYDSAVV